MKPKVLFSGKVHLYPEKSKEITLIDADGLNSITFDLGYLPLFDNKTVYAEIADNLESFKVVALKFIGHPKPSQRSLSIDSIGTKDFTFPLKLLLISESEIFFNLKVFGI